MQACNFEKWSPDGPRSTKLADKNESDYAIYLRMCG